MTILILIMSYIWHEIINVKKKIKKLYFMVFFTHLRFDTGLSVVPIGKPVIPISILIFYFWISKFQFRPIFIVTGVTDWFRRQCPVFQPVRGVAG
jgi:hypothetical protein